MEEVKTRGPLFDHHAEVEAKAFCHDVELDVADEAVRRIQDYLPTQYKYLGHSGGNPKDNPVPPDAGHYQSQVHAESSPEGQRVTDGDVIYGPWLEGVSERNRARRFPGYGAFRKISQEVDQDSLVMAEKKLPPYLAAMNGV